tara:strand:- start:271 stop:540 length:270 start_codon:yes stop_codon:yes gene_type:complete
MSIHIEKGTYKDKDEYNKIYSSKWRKTNRQEYRKEQIKQYNCNLQSRLEYQREYDRKNYTIKYERAKERVYMNKFGNIMSEFLCYLDTL